MSYILRMRLVEIIGTHGTQQQNGNIESILILSLVLINGIGILVMVILRMSIGLGLMLGILQT